MINLLRAINRSAIISLAALVICAGALFGEARAQEAPRDSGTLIKPPTIKPPTVKSKTNNGGSATGKSRRKRSRRRRARRPRPLASVERGNTSAVITESVGSASQPPMVGGASGNASGVTASIKPPTNTTGGVNLSTPRAHKPISGGVLNGRALSLPIPVYPPIARAARASGTVVVQVLVDEEGRVMEGHAVSGHPLLQNAAKEAALHAVFPPTRLSGQAVKVTGVITYDFAAN